MIVYIAPPYLSEGTKIIEYIKGNPDKCKWVNDRIVFNEEGQWYVSGIEFFDKEECIMACLRFGLVKFPGKSFFGASATPSTVTPAPTSGV